MQHECSHHLPAEVPFWQCCIASPQCWWTAFPVASLTTAAHAARSSGIVQLLASARSGPKSALQGPAMHASLLLPFSVTSQRGSTKHGSKHHSICKVAQTLPLSVPRTASYKHVLLLHLHACVPCRRAWSYTKIRRKEGLKAQKHGCQRGLADRTAKPMLLYLEPVHAAIELWHICHQLQAAAHGGQHARNLLQVCTCKRCLNALEQM